MNNFCIFIVILVICILLYCNFKDLFIAENYTPQIVRYSPTVQSQNNCPYPLTEKNKNTFAPVNDKIQTYQYANRKILNPDDYLEMIKHLLNDLSSKNINVTNISDNDLIEKEYLGDKKLIIDFINEKIRKLVNEKSYLQQNGNWKYEYFNVSDPKIYYYQVNNKLNTNLPSTFNLFKIIYTLGNPLRSSYTSCLAFITDINNKLDLQYSTLVNDIDNKSTSSKTNLDILEKEKLNFSYIDTIADDDFDKFGNPTDHSGLDYIFERKGKKIEIKADIPQEFKNNTLQRLPPQFGSSGNYPPLYKNPETGKMEYHENSPIAKNIIV